jgi:hypothetical protein
VRTEPVHDERRSRLLIDGIDECGCCRGITTVKSAA